MPPSVPTPPSDASAAAGPPAPAQRRLAPVDLPMVPFVLGGMVVWAIIGLIGLANRSTLAANGHENWLKICLAGVLLGLPGLALMIPHDVNRRRRRAASRA